MTTAHERSADTAASYVYDAWNEADHANSLMANARHELREAEDIVETLAWLRKALEPAGRLESRIQSAIEYLEALQRENAAK